MVTIDREAAPATAVAAVPALVAALAGRRGAALALGVLPAAIALFFRDPDRRPDDGGPRPALVRSTRTLSCLLPTARSCMPDPARTAWLPRGSGSR